MDPYRPRQAQTVNFDPRLQYPPSSRVSQQRSPQPGPTQQRYKQQGYAQQFPPHPSVRLPPNVRPAAGQVPAGVGVASRPMPGDANPQYQQRQTAPPRHSPGQLAKDFVFPQAPPPIPQTIKTKRSRDLSKSPGKRYNMHDSYMSSVREDSTTPEITPKTTPNSKFRGFQAPQRYSDSVYTESEAADPDDYSDRHTGQGNALNAPNYETGIVRQASMGKRGKPAVTMIKHGDHDQRSNVPEATSPTSSTSPSNRTATINALSAAVAAGIGNQPPAVRSVTPASRSGTPVRMPFDTSDPDPENEKEDLEPPQINDSLSKDHSAMQTPNSTHSNNPLLGLGIDATQPSMSSRIPVSRRPPRLDIDAVREAEARGSTTSLAELIRRATKLAANLDRGKTASRLGMLDMLGSSEKLGHYPNRRDSDMSDMISAFPAPATRSSSKRDTMWPTGEKGDYIASGASKDGRNSKGQKRRCCGLSIPVFISVLIVIVLLIAAAVLIPIFLILVPKQQHSGSVDLSKCPTEFPCHNGGASIVSNSTCTCVCSDGFLGSQCDVLGDSTDCTTMAASDGRTHYDNATVGQSIMPLFSDAQAHLNIPLNASTLLSLFATNNLSCASENSLVDFNSSNTGAKAKRFIILPDVGNAPKSPSQSIILPFQTTTTAPIGAQETKSSDPRLEVRSIPSSEAGTVGTSNGIVFQATTTAATASPTPFTATTDSAVSTVTSLSSQSASNSTSDSLSSGVTSSQVSFAQVVVMYVLEQSQALSVAVNAQQRLAAALENAQTAKGNVNVGFGDLKITANLGNLTVTLGDGTVLGGGGNSSRK